MRLLELAAFRPTPVLRTTPPASGGGGVVGGKFVILSGAKNLLRWPRSFTTSVTRTACRLILWITKLSARAKNLPPPEAGGGRRKPGVGLLLAVLVMLFALAPAGASSFPPPVV